MHAQQDEGQPARHVRHPSRMAPPGWVASSQSAMQADVHQLIHWVGSPMLLSRRDSLEIPSAADKKSWNRWCMQVAHFRNRLRCREGSDLSATLANFEASTIKLVQYKCGFRSGEMVSRRCFWQTEPRPGLVVRQTGRRGFLGTGCSRYTREWDITSNTERTN